MLPPAALVAFAAQSVPPTVIYPPRIPFVFTVDVTAPLVEFCVPIGSVKSTVPPMLWVRAPRSRSSGFKVGSALIKMFDAPGLSVRPLNRWLLIVLALPVRVSVPCAKKSAEVLATLLMILIAGAPAAEKSRLSVPRLTVVVPV